jgi:uncharacterized damage-inducible protein DinB
METHQQYKTRIQGLVTGKDPIAVQRQTPSQLAALISDVRAEKLNTRPAPNAWSVTEILAHMSEAEITASWRYRQMLEHDGCPLAPYGQELWAELGGYTHRDPADSLQLFRLLRQSNLQMLDKLTPEQWLRHGMHAERGEMTVKELALQIAGHDINHVAQIEAIVK